ncbi:hypothetical protein BO94DRAFT_530493 [Aspergillus sclerotioniger CBS 115572]|uniref:Uncharacterized protein n=1 Tax=Aspergillus sclerotioniger CBS 115572 TaxID=1450535 RepID=A0A317XAY8_9EURO|nr:hypothetical protein BO94DRAFT_530493 [Aspergillus sclerotioniger CBS 115572]PWY95753.1 hypothetical protein BO94DRAFT_530493 [Aspergillus sclerotioniger CBS 115572]
MASTTLPSSIPNSGSSSHEQGYATGKKTSASTLIPSASSHSYKSASPLEPSSGIASATQMAATPLFTGAASRASKGITELLVVLGGAWMLL